MNKRERYEKHEVRRGMSRRGLLQLGGATIAGIWIAGGDPASAFGAGATAHPLAATATPEDFAGVRTRWREMLLGDDSLDPDMPEVRAVVDRIDRTASAHLTSMERGVERTSLWADLPFPEDANNKARLVYSVSLRKTYERIRSLANAYALPSAAHFGDLELRSAIFDGLRWLVETKYFHGVVRRGNWYNWQIGAPLALLPTALLMYDEIDPTLFEESMSAIDFQQPVPTMRGANLIWTSQVVAQRGALVEDAEKLTIARDRIPDALKVVTEGNGIYPDGSLIQHDRHAYTGGYGQAMLKATSRLLFILAGSPWALGGRGLDNIVNWGIEGFAPWVRKGAMPGAVRGRVIARPSRPDHEVGLSGTLSLMWLAHSADEDRARILRGHVRHTIDDHYGNIFDTSELSSIAGAKRIQRDSTIEPLPPENRCIQYAYMDRTLHVRPGFTFVLAMSSNRIYTYELDNQENLRGWHTGSGMQYLHNDDAAHYEEDFWPTVDHTRLPGTTVPAGLRETGAGANFRSVYHWAGGVATGGAGVSGMQFQTYSETEQDAAPTGRKSWFLFDDVILALGAGIRSSSGEAVESIAENRRILDPAQRFVVDGVEHGPTDGESESDGAWAHLEGRAPTAGIGYVLGDTARIKREARTGAWADVNTNPAEFDDTPIQAEYATIWFDHGVDPSDASYVYTLLPGATAVETAAYAADPGFTVLSNTRQVQAARWGGTLGLNVWERGAPAIDGVSCSGPACVLLVQDADRLSFAVSDPTHRAAAVTVRIERTLTEVASDERVSVRRMHGITEIDVDLAGAGGQRIAADFLLGNRG